MPKTVFQQRFRRILEDVREGTTSIEQAAGQLEALMPQPDALPILAKVTQQIPAAGSSFAQRMQALERAGFNIFHVGEEDGIRVDFLTDSGTGTMSDAQWAAMLGGTEWYAGSKSFTVFEQSFHDVFGPQFTIIPAHQGRSAESTLLDALKQSGILAPGKKAVFNTAFDTTHGWVSQITGFPPENLYCEDFEKPLDEPAPFKGNLDPKRLQARLKAGDVGAVFLTVTNNTSGGQPASLDNIRQVGKVCREFGVPFFLDACRFAENAYFIQQREAGQQQRSIQEIVRDMFEHADGATFSAKKDGKANIGGAILIRNDAAMEKVQYAAKILTIMRDGFVSYGGLAGRDLEAIAQGIHETTQEGYLRQRVGQVQYLHRLLDTFGVPLVHPCGGHAVYVNAREYLPDVPHAEYRGVTLSLALFAAYGIRTVEIGDFMYGRKDAAGNLLEPAKNDFVRLAVPRMTYASEHMLYVAACFADLNAKKHALKRGVKVLDRFENNHFDHFFARFKLLDPTGFEATLQHAQIQESGKQALP